MTRYVIDTSCLPTSLCLYHHSLLPMVQVASGVTCTILVHKSLINVVGPDGISTGRPCQSHSWVQISSTCLICCLCEQDGNVTSWSAAELADILAIWRAVSEDYSPFDVDVTTEDPGAAYLATNGIRVAIGGSCNDCECLIRYRDRPLSPAYSESNHGGQMAFDLQLVIANLMLPGWWW